MAQIITGLVWNNKDNQMPEKGKKILAFSPKYDKNDSSRIRLIDGQFLKSLIDAELWAYVYEPDTDI